MTKEKRIEMQLKIQKYDDIAKRISCLNKLIEPSRRLRIENNAGAPCCWCSDEMQEALVLIIKMELAREEKKLEEL